MEPRKQRIMVSSLTTPSVGKEDKLTCSERQQLNKDSEQYDGGGSNGYE